MTPAHVCFLPKTLKNKNTNPRTVPGSLAAGHGLLMPTTATLRWAGAPATSQAEDGRDLGPSPPCCWLGWAGQATPRWPGPHLALAAAPVAAPHQALVVLVLLGQVVVEDALGHRLRGQRQRSGAALEAGARGLEPTPHSSADQWVTWHSDLTSQHLNSPIRGDSNT